MLLFKRFKFSSKPEMFAIRKQKKIIKNVNKKIKNKKYKFAKINKCPICNNNDYKTIAEKDRYGFKVNTQICKSCGLVFLNPHFDDKTYSEFYQKEYRSLYDNEEEGTNRLFDGEYSNGKNIYKYIRNEINIKNKTVIEIGVGAGGTLKYFKEKGAKVYGVDYGTDYLEYGKKMGLNLYSGNIKVLLDKKINADLIIYSHVMEHITDLNKEFKNIKKILNKNGCIYIEVPGIKDLINTHHHNYLEYAQNVHVYNFTKATLKNLLVKNDFNMIKGDEYIKSLSKLESKNKINKKISNEYDNIVSFIRILETKRKKRFMNPKYIRILSIRKIIIILDYLRLYNIVRKIYYKNK